MSRAIAIPTGARIRVVDSVTVAVRAFDSIGFKTVRAFDSKTRNGCVLLIPRTVVSLRSQKGSRQVKI
jgi:hypothetical protein